jgi:hypothetical protein
VQSHRRRHQEKLFLGAEFLQTGHLLSKQMTEGKGHLFGCKKHSLKGNWENVADKKNIFRGIFSMLYLKLKNDTFLLLFGEFSPKLI